MVTTVIMITMQIVIVLKVDVIVMIGVMVPMVVGVENVNGKMCQAVRYATTTTTMKGLI